ncbi:MAG: peptidase M20 [Ponticaulis sp.]|nr:peptidase M20 [Ponticaulis sp.]
MADDITNTDRFERMKAVRRQIHAHPEMAFKEFQTSELVADRLESLGLRVRRAIGGTGVVGTLARGNGGSIGLRADMDALPIREAGNHAYKSKNDGVMHACGHDGHTAMLLGAAEALSQTMDFSGTVHFIFQPAEENEGGGRRMVQEGLFREHPCDAIFALHNWPGLAAGRVAVQPGPMMASYDTFTITLTGKGGHAAMPESTRDPIPVAAELILALQTIVSRKISPHDPAVISVTRIRGGETFNVIPEEVEFSGTVRCFSETVRKRLQIEIEHTTKAVANAHHIDAELQYDWDYPPTINTDKEANFAADTARALYGAERVDTSFRPSMASEDFAVMLQEVPGAYIWLGIGEDAAPLHNPHYDFNDDVLLTGADLLAGLARDFLKA